MYQKLKNIGHYIEALLWRVFYGFPDQALHIYGVTGTNGKTTTSYILTSILFAEYGKEKVGMLTTVAFRIGAEEEINTSKMTTLPSRKIFKYLSQMKKFGVTHVVLETTSHALDQHRIAGIELSGAIILNIAREHLDYHKTIEGYADAKEKIISYLKQGAPLVGKQDDEFVKKMLDRAEQNNIHVVRMTSKDIHETNTPLAGSINKENAAAAKLLGMAIGISAETISSGISAVTKVPGRMEKIVAPQGFTVIIDYAVTPDALERLYADTKKEIIGKGRILATLSAAGLRDRGKRADMARAVAKYADKIIVTREDPWTESEEQIFSDLESGLPSLRPAKPLGEVGSEREIRWERIPDRREAFATLIRDAKPGDVVIATGKGAERGMGIGKKVIPWNEREVIEEILTKLN